jgi:hypothetical protein
MTTGAGENRRPPLCLQTYSDLELERDAGSEEWQIVSRAQLR